MRSNTQSVSPSFPTTQPQRSSSRNSRRSGSGLAAFTVVVRFRGTSGSYSPGHHHRLLTTFSWCLARSYRTRQPTRGRRSRGSQISPGAPLALFNDVFASCGTLAWWLSGCRAVARPVTA